MTTAVGAVAEGRLILASGSATRTRLLAEAGVAASVVRPGVDEEAVKASMRAEGASPADLAMALAELKAQRVSWTHADAFVVGADQVLACDGATFDKPPDLAQARAQLLALRGRRHELVTAVCVAKAGAVIWRHQERARLTMRAFSDEFLDQYLDQAGARVLRSAGAYELEGLGVHLFVRVDGDFFAILGLPLLPLLAFLRGHRLVPQ